VRLMKRSTAVTLGLVMVAGMSFACSSEPDQEFMDVTADSQEICVKRDTMERVTWEHCEEDAASGHAHYYPWYHGSAHGPAPAVGSKVNPHQGSAIRPGGTVARPPSTGGFGTSGVSSGS
jgi:hypothetical protein